MRRLITSLFAFLSIHIAIYYLFTIILTDYSNRSEDQALIVHSKTGRRNPHHSKGKNFYHKYNIRNDLSILRCYTCDERRHFAKD